MENEILDAFAVTRRDALTDAKLWAVERLTMSRGSLLDFGAGSGKYLHFSRSRFQHVEGVEITPTCIVFAGNELGVVLRPELQQGRHYDVVTAWHAIEHVPPEAVRRLVAQIHDAAEEAFIISVPNSKSWASKWLGTRYPYYDANSHFHQFSPESMRRLLGDAGWEAMLPFRIELYSLFCWAQGFVNVLTGSHNLLYYRIKRGRVVDSLSRCGILVHGALFVICLPIAMMISILERLSPRRGACINMVCYKPPRHAGNAR